MSNLKQKGKPLLQKTFEKQERNGRPPEKQQQRRSQAPIQGKETPRPRGAQGWWPNSLCNTQWPRRTSRDLLPLPVPLAEEVLKTNLSRSCKRRIQRRIHVQQDVAETVLGVNQLYNFDSGGDRGADTYISSAQSKSLEFIKGCVQGLGSPGNVDGSGALAALRVSDGYGQSHHPWVPSIPNLSVSLVV